MSICNYHFWDVFMGFKSNNTLGLMFANRMDRQLSYSVFSCKDAALQVLMSVCLCFSKLKFCLIPRSWLPNTTQGYQSLPRFQGINYMSLHTCSSMTFNVILWPDMQVHEIACSSLHKLAYSIRGLHAVRLVCYSISLHICNPPITPVLYHELSQWNTVCFLEN